MDAGLLHAEPASPDPGLPDAVLAAYGLDGAKIETLSGGRTNRTMRVRAGRDLVVQHMRADAGMDLLGVMENLVRLTGHLDWKRRVESVGEAWYPDLVPTQAGKPFIMNDEGDVWRAFSYRPGQIARSAQPPATTASIARLYGRFAGETKDLGGPPLIETDSEFHDLDVVHDGLMADVAAADPVRRAQVEELLPLIVRLHDLVERRSADDGLGACPQRVVHNDTKFSNVLLDRDQGEAIAVLDLDLAMMGPCWHDVGDLVRSACWHQLTSDSPTFDTEQFGSIIASYIAGAAGTLAPTELATFAVAGPRISFELGLRYLNDHLRDEPHLRVEGGSGHLRRGIANLKLAEEMFAAYDALRLIVEANLPIGPEEPEGMP